MVRNPHEYLRHSSPPLVCDWERHRGSPLLPSCTTNNTIWQFNGPTAKYNGCNQLPRPIEAISMDIQPTMMPPASADARESNCQGPNRGDRSASRKVISAATIALPPTTNPSSNARTVKSANAVERNTLNGICIYPTTNLTAPAKALTRRQTDRRPRLHFVCFPRSWPYHLFRAAIRNERSDYIALSEAYPRRFTRWIQWDSSQSQLPHNSMADIACLYRECGKGRMIFLKFGDDSPHFSFGES
jgi:hypothetical protein